MVERAVCSVGAKAAAFEVGDHLREMQFPDSRIAEAFEVEGPVGHDGIGELIVSEEIEDAAFIKDPLMADVLAADPGF